jgi:putative spermidine/putrescine transport system permease protein
MQTDSVRCRTAEGSFKVAEMGEPRSSARIRIPVWPLLLVPAGVFFIVFFVAPMVSLLITSFYDYSRLGGVIPTFTLKNYAALFSDLYSIQVIIRTLELAFSTAVITLLIGYPVALYLTLCSERQRAIVIMAILSPLLVSVVVRTFGWVIILGHDGLLDHAFKSIGWSLPPLLHTQTAVIIGLANVLLPFVVLSVTTSLQAIDRSVTLAAASLGANFWRGFWHVTLPLSLPGVASGFLISFSLASSSFVTPSLLGGGSFEVISTKLYTQAMVMQNWPSAASYAAALVMIVLLVLVVQSRLVENGKFKVVFH